MDLELMQAWTREGIRWQCSGVIPRARRSGGPSETDQHRIEYVFQLAEPWDTAGVKTESNSKRHVPRLRQIAEVIIFDFWSSNSVAHRYRCHKWTPSEMVVLKVSLVSINRARG